MAFGAVKQASAQSSSPLISFKQKLLSQKREDNIEKIDSFSKLHLMIGGNVYQTEKHAAYAYDKKTKKYDYKTEFKYIQPLLNLGDISLVNLKTSFSNNTKNMFSSPDEFGLALKYAGINAVMHANVHTANISKSNLKRTHEVLDEYDIYHTGAFLDNQQRNGNFPLIINRKGFKVAILNYTNLVARPSVSRDFVINEIDKSTIDRDMRMAHAYHPDFTIVYFDWGANTQDAPSYAQQELAQYVFQAGANLVVGTHPNTPMRLETINYSYNGEQHEGIIAYSMGNLLSSNEDLRNRNGFLIDMELQKNNFTRETQISDWGVIPVYTYYDTTTVKGKTNVYSVPCANVESADIFPDIPYIEKRRAVNSAYEVRKLLGTIADEIQYNLNELIVNNVMESIDITNAPLNNKYNPKREEEVAPSAAPELPVATDSASFNTPSLALLYEQQPAQAKAMATAGTPGKASAVAGNKPSTAAAIKAQQKTEKENSYLSQRKKAEALMDGSAAKNDTTGPGETLAANTQAGQATNSTTTTTPPSETNSTTETTTAGKEKTAGDATDAKSKSTKTNSGRNPAKKDQSVNTNYRTTGKDYDLKDPAKNTATKGTADEIPVERIKESGIELPTAGTNGVGTGLSTTATAETELKKVEYIETERDTVYRIQFYALKTFIPLDTNYYTHLKGYEVWPEEGLFKYMLGRYRSLSECEQYWKTQIQPRYKQSFIVKFVNGKKVAK